MFINPYSTLILQKQQCFCIIQDYSFYEQQKKNVNCSDCIYQSYFVQLTTFCSPLPNNKFVTVEFIVNGHPYRLLMLGQYLLLLTAVCKVTE